MLQVQVGLHTQPHVAACSRPPVCLLRSLGRARTAVGPSSIRHKRTRSRRIPCLASLVIEPQLVFNSITFCVMPLYAMMTVFPSRKLTRTVISSPWLYTAAGLLYVGALLVWGRQEMFHLLWAATQQYFRTWQVQHFAILFESPSITALTWTHLLLLDLFVARHVYLDGLQRKVATAHSVILCFMFGPTGLLSHMLTKYFVERNQERYTQQMS